MLVFTVKEGEKVICGEATILVKRIGGSTVKLCFDAPRGVPIDREKVAKRKAGENNAGDNNRR